MLPRGLLKACAVVELCQANLWFIPELLLLRPAGVRATWHSFNSKSYKLQVMYSVCPDIQPIEMLPVACYHQATICLKRHQVLYTITFDTSPVWFHQRQPPPSEAPPVSEALVSDKKLLSLLSPVLPLCGPPWLWRGVCPYEHISRQKWCVAHVSGHTD